MGAMVIRGAVAAIAAAAIIMPMICLIGLMESRIKEMAKGPKLPHKLKWGDRTAARVDEAEYPIGIGLVGYTGIKDVIIAEVRESVADGVGAWNPPPEDLKGAGSSDVFMKKPRAGAYYKYIKLKNIVHEES